MDTAPTTAVVGPQVHRETWADVPTDALQQFRLILGRKTADPRPDEIVESMGDEPSRVNAAYNLGRRSIYFEVNRECERRSLGPHFQAPHDNHDSWISRLWKLVRP